MKTKSNVKNNVIFLRGHTIELINGRKISFLEHEQEDKEDK